jgi:hypothetical protein
MKMVRSFIYVVLMTFATTMYSQHVHPHEDAHKGIRIAALIGHTMIKSEGSDAHLFIPSWGLDIEYWISNKWGIGLHNDIEIESFIVVTKGEEDIERINPLVVTLDALYHFKSGLVLSGGPGVELAEGESFYLFRFGAELEVPISNGFDVVPSIFFDQRFDGFSTWTVALGIGKHF